MPGSIDGEVTSPKVRQPWWRFTQRVTTPLKRGTETLAVRHPDSVRPASNLCTAGACREQL